MSSTSTLFNKTIAGDFLETPGRSVNVIVVVIGCVVGALMIFAISLVYLRIRRLSLAEKLYRSCQKNSMFEYSIGPVKMEDATLSMSRSHLSLDIRRTSFEQEKYRYQTSIPPDKMQYLTEIPGMDGDGIVKIDENALMGGILDLEQIGGARLADEISGTGSITYTGVMDGINTSCLMDQMAEVEDCKAVEEIYEVYGVGDDETNEIEGDKIEEKSSIYTAECTGILEKKEIVGGKAEASTDQLVNILDFPIERIDSVKQNYTDKDLIIEEISDAVPDVIVGREGERDKISTAQLVIVNR